MTMIMSVYKGNNAGLISHVAPLWVHENDRVLDVTYGRGKWWTKYHPLDLTTHDILVDGVDFRRLPEGDCSIDVVAYDPPYVAMGGRVTSGTKDFNDRYGLEPAPRTPLELQAMIADGLKEISRVLRPGGRVLAKTCNYVSSGKLVLGHHHMVAAGLDCGLAVADEIVHMAGTGPQPKTNRDGSPRRQVHARRAHSFLVVFIAEKRKVCL